MISLCETYSNSGCWLDSIKLLIVGHIPILLSNFRWLSVRRKFVWETQSIKNVTYHRRDARIQPSRGGHIVRGRAALVNRYAESPHLMRIRWVVEGIKYETAR